MWRTKLISGMLLIIISGATLASGGNHGGSYSYSAPKPVDATYERGKAIYTGRLQGYQKIRYCIDNGAEHIKLKRKSLKPFKNGSVEALTSKLYNCKNPDTPISEILNNTDYAHVIYYLNKRFRLNLHNS